MSIYQVLKDEQLASPALVAALDGWVDAGAAGTTAAGFLARGGDVVVSFDMDSLVDYRSRRPTLDIQGGVLTGMEWPELTVRCVHAGDRDLLVLTGPEPDFHWHAFRDAVGEIAERLGVVDCVCLGAIGATVPHTRPTPILITGRDRGSLKSDVPLPAEHMQVPASALNLIEIHLAQKGIRSVGIWAQVPHYIVGTYFPGALALVERALGHLGVDVPVESLAELVREQRERLDSVVASRPDAGAYVDQLEAAGPIPLVPPGEDLASEVERFLREATGDNRNPFEDPPEETP